MENYYDGKPSNSETSSEENDQAAEKFTNENAGVGRFYECIFCKRGFTNAQALGGHMNIHRKDKAKAEQKARQCLVTNKSNEEFMSSRNNDKFSNEQPQYYAVPIASQNNYQCFFPGSNPNFSQGYDHLGGDFVGPRQQHLSLFADHHQDLNLSMHFDHCHHEKSESCRKNTWELEENKVDLELRLG